jgi:predicted metalloprotease with PDZ domain
MKRLSIISFWLFVVLGAFVSFVPLAAGTMAFTVSMPRPASHYFHITFRCEGLKGAVQDFEMPAWMPGFYKVLDYEKNVTNFRVADGAGQLLPWEKVSRNTWRVASDEAAAILVDYDVFGNMSFPAQSFLDAQRAFLAPPGVFMHVAGQLRNPVTVAVTLPAGWSQISTGLDPVQGRPATFSAPDFDVLYDCPILMGSQEVRQFEVRGVPHKVVIENIPETVDRQKIVADLKQIVGTATRLIGDIPYTHYTFFLIGMGNGGIEHGNSAACLFNGKSLADAKGYQSWLSYVSHEYFHNFNVKRIRPIALGPFDYETENLTNMLWVSEGLTVYYEDIVMVRAGLMTPGEYLAMMTSAMARFENTPGRRYQSATESSLQTWGGSGFGGDRNTTISYYDDGAMLGAMLDLKIRNESGNRKSLDDVMRTLYRTYYQEKKRGFTDAEFREECERAAGAPLAEVFEYASTTKGIDYAKFFAYAGLHIDDAPQGAPGTSLGVDTQTLDGKLLITDVMAGSPAQNAHLQAHDEIQGLDGVPASTKVLSDLLAAKKPGDKVKIRILRAGEPQDLTVTLGKNVKHAFSVAPMTAPSPLQAAILKDWLRKAF